MVLHILSSSICIIGLLLNKANAYSACDEVDINFLIDTDSIKNKKDDTLDFIEDIILHGSSEYSGFSVFLYGNIPNDFDNWYIGLDSNWNSTLRINTIKNVNDALEEAIHKLDAAGSVTTNENALDVFRLLVENVKNSKPERDHKRTSDTDIPGVGSYDDRNVFFIFDYDNKFIDADTTDICDIYKEYDAVKQDSSLHFMIGPNHNLDFDSYKINCAADVNMTLLEDISARYTFIPFEDAVGEESNYTEMVYGITCPIDVDASAELGLGAEMTLGNHVQFMDPYTIIKCNLIDDDNTPELALLSDDSYILVDDCDYDDNTFQLNDYLISTLSAYNQIKSKPGCCELEPVKIKRIEEQPVDLSNINCRRKKLFVNVPENPMEYIAGSQLPNGTLTNPGYSECEADDQFNDVFNDEYESIDILTDSELDEYFENVTDINFVEYDDFDWVDIPDDINDGSWDIEPFRRRLGSYNLPKVRLGRKIKKKKTVGSNSLEVELGYKFLFEAGLRYHMRWNVFLRCGCRWFLKCWCHAPYLDFRVSAVGAIELGAWFKANLKGQLSQEFRNLMNYHRTLKFRVAGIPITLRPFFMLNAKIETLPIEMYAGINCEYRREWEMGYWMRTSSWFRNFRHGPIRRDVVKKNQCFKEIGAGKRGEQKCGPHQLGFNIIVEPIIGVSLYELVAVYLRNEFKLPFRITLPETNNAICSGLNNCDIDKQYASFKIDSITYNLYLGYATDITPWRVIKSLLGANNKH
mmetsp:Transcript_48740/g.43709  ORF Transcript_48740/g.43709 Transcript_48740/m.43709 type:complete len:750 (-) Transcript_48740:197-2446(-)